MEIIGRIKKIFPTVDVTPTFKKRELVITTEEQYPQHILIEFTQDKSTLLDHLQEGELVKIGINIRGREWVTPQGETKYFNSIQGWRIDKNMAMQQGYTQGYPQGYPQQGYTQQGYATQPEQGQAPTQGQNSSGQGFETNNPFPPAPDFVPGNDPDDLPF